VRFERRLKYTTLILFSIEVIITLVDLIASSWKHTSEIAEGIAAEHSSELEYVWLDWFQVLFGLSVIYMLSFYQRFTDRVAFKEDPFSNGNLLGVVVYLVVL
jgi:hypothetical protein